MKNGNNSNLEGPNLLLKENIIESKNFYNLFFICVILMGSIGFFIVGLSSYLKYNIIFFLDSKDIIFFPQGITMIFYGISGILVSIYQILLIFFEVGDGFNEFDKSKGTMRIFRKNFPAYGSNIDIIYELKEIEAVRVESKTDIFNTRQKIFVCIRGKNDLPVLQINEPLTLKELEEKATKLACFLKVPLRGL